MPSEKKSGSQGPNGAESRESVGQAVTQAYAASGVHSLVPPSSDTTPDTVAIGDIIDGKYRITGIVGQGGMAVVASAWHLDLQEHVALKILSAEALQVLNVKERFLNEARSARRLHSPHVVKVLDVGRFGEAGVPYLAMELLQGEDLAQVLGAQRLLPLTKACEYVLQACDALAEAHALGIYHRDIKPANLFRAKGPQGSQGSQASQASQAELIKVLDFGIAKVMDRSAPAMTHPLDIFGTLAYMSPEQIRSSREADARSDIWSLGVTLYELTTGQLPFSGKNVGELASAVLGVEPEPPSKVFQEHIDAPSPPSGRYTIVAPRSTPQSGRAPISDAPPSSARGPTAAFDAVVLRCLQKDAAHRYASILELATALAPHMGSGPKTDVLLQSIRSRT